MANLNDIKGYRAKPINALNDAVRRARIIGGDVTTEESEAGTRLFIERAYPQSRFDLFFGLAELEEGKLEPTLCIGDGAFFVNGDVIILKNATNVKYCHKGIRPRSSGWASKGAPEKGSSGNAWEKCEVLILYYGEEYYIAFRYDDMELYKLISEDATEDIESAIEIVLNIGSFKFSDSSIVQNVNSDIFYTKSGTTEAESLNPFEVRFLGWNKKGELSYSGIFGIRNGLWSHVAWITKAQFENAGMSSNGAPKLYFAVSSLDENYKDSEPIKDNKGNEFFDISFTIPTMQVGDIAEICVIHGGFPRFNLSVVSSIIPQWNYNQRHRGNQLKVAEIKLKRLIDGILPDYEVRTFTGDVEETVSEGGTRLYSVTSNSSGTTYSNAYGTQFDSSLTYVLASFWVKTVKQNNSTISVEEMSDALATQIPVTSHSSDHLGGVL